MRNVTIDQLRPGDIIAQHILSQDNSILLASGSILTAKTIEALQNWQIKVVRLREEQDSDEDVKLALQFDDIIRPFQELPDAPPAPLAKQTDETDAPQKKETLPPSIINEKSARQYDSICTKVAEILRDRHLYTNVATLESMAHIVHRFASATPGAIGYTLKPTTAEPPLRRLALHSLAVAIISNKLAYLLGYNDEQVKTITLGALLHDIGKLALPPTILDLTRQRSNDEETLYRSHVKAGADLFLRKQLPDEVVAILLQHHEAIDGSGFPKQLKGGQLSIAAQIVALANRFDALIHDDSELPDLFTIRPRLLRDSSGKITADIIDIFDRYLATFTYSVNVLLSDGRTAEVLYTHSAFRFPVVKTGNGELLDLNKQPDVRITRLKV